MLQGGGVPAGGADLQGEVRRGEISLPEHFQNPEGARPAGPDATSVPRRLEEGEQTFNASKD